MSNIEEQDIILDSITDGVFTVDHEWRITSFNRSAEDITGVSREEAIGHLCKDVLKADMRRKLCHQADDGNGRVYKGQGCQYHKRRRGTDADQHIHRIAER